MKEALKRCSKCNQMNGMNEFRMACNICRSCRNEATRKWRARHPGYHNLYNARYKAAKEGVQEEEAPMLVMPLLLQNE